MANTTTLMEQVRIEIPSGCKIERDVTPPDSLQWYEAYVVGYYGEFMYYACVKETEDKWYFKPHPTEHDTHKCCGPDTKGWHTYEYQSLFGFGSHCKGFSEDKIVSVQRPGKSASITSTIVPIVTTAETSSPFSNWKTVEPETGSTDTIFKVVLKYQEGFMPGVLEKTFETHNEAVEFIHQQLRWLKRINSTVQPGTITNASAILTNPSNNTRETYNFGF